MSMTREEAIEELERLLRHWDDLENDKRCFWGYDKEAVALALSALRPVSREQVILCKDCQYWQGNNGGYPHPDCRWGMMKRQMKMIIARLQRDWR